MNVLIVLLALSRGVAQLSEEYVTKEQSECVPITTDPFRWRGDKLGLAGSTVWMGISSSETTRPIFVSLVALEDGDESALQEKAQIFFGPNCGMTTAWTTEREPVYLGYPNGEGLIFGYGHFSDQGKERDFSFVGFTVPHWCNRTVISTRHDDNFIISADDGDRTDSDFIFSDLPNNAKVCYFPVRTGEEKVGFDLRFSNVSQYPIYECKTYDCKPEDGKITSHFPGSAVNRARTDISFYVMDLAAMSKFEYLHIELKPTAGPGESYSNNFLHLDISEGAFSRGEDESLLLLTATGHGFKPAPTDKPSRATRFSDFPTRDWTPTFSDAFSGTNNFTASDAIAVSGGIASSEPLKPSSAFPPPDDDDGFPVAAVAGGAAGAVAVGIIAAVAYYCYKKRKSAAIDADGSKPSDAPDAAKGDETRGTDTPPDNGGGEGPTQITDQTVQPAPEDGGAAAAEPANEPEPPSDLNTGLLNLESMPPESDVPDIRDIDL